MRVTDYVNQEEKKGASIINSIDMILGLGIAEVGLLTTILAAPVMIVIESPAIVVGIIKVVGCQAKKKCSLKAEKHKKIETLACSALNRISGLIPKHQMMRLFHMKISGIYYYNLTYSHTRKKI